MEDKRPPVLQREIAEKAGVSLSTVSIVLNGRGDEMRISRATQERVHAVASQLSYSPNIYARRLRKTGNRGFLQSIGVLWYSDYSDETMGRFFHGAFEALQGRRAELSVQMYEADQLFKHGDLLLSNFYNGIVINGASYGDVEYLRGIKPAVPVVLSGQSIESLSCTYVDNYALGRRCARLIHEHGHSSVGIIGYGRRTAGGSLRLTGLLDGCRELGLRIDEEWRVPTDSLTIEGGYQAMQALRRIEYQPSCLFVMTDLEALGVILYSKEHGLDNMDGRGVLTYGYNKTLLAMAPHISYACIQIEDMARQTMELMQMLLDNQIARPINQMITPEIQCGNL